MGTRADSDELRPTLDAPTLTLASASIDSTGEVAALDHPLLEELGFTGRYAELDVLGEGGMGVVKLYADRQIGRRVALKRLLPGRCTNDEARGRFVHEARVQGQLEHPAVVPVYDLGLDQDGAIYFTMKRVRGVTLAEIVAGLRSPRESTMIRWSRRRLLTAFSSVCLAVDFAHQRGVLHRDLKPGNVMLGDFGEVYVLDWGLARVHSDSDPEMDTALELPAVSSRAVTQTGAVLGTLGYMSPEQLRGDAGALGPASDVYALGAILFELLTLEPLHDGQNPTEILTSNLGGADARPSVRAPSQGVPPELEAIVVKATLAEPSHRFKSAREIHSAVESFLDGERDVEHRREMAKRHTRAAEEAVERARDEESPQFQQRRRAMQEIGRALALDPDDPAAMKLMVRLLNEPPRILPREVRGELERVRRGNIRWMGTIGGLAYASMLAYLPFLLWNGVRDWTWPGIFYAAALLASGLSFWVASQRRPSQTGVLAVVLLSNIAFASTAAFFGPFTVTPALLAVNATGFALNLSALHRHVAIASACVFACLAIAGSLTGVMPGGMSFDGASMTTAAGALDLPRVPSLVFLSVVAVAAVITGTLAVTRVRDKLAATERQLYLYAWHLRELVPEAVRGPTDPTLSRPPGLRIA
jgi:eukaryotic-like serine/threonine-protein kinase